MIPFNKPYMTGKELWNIAQAHASGHLSGDGEFTKKCSAWLRSHTGASTALLTHSCTAALEMSALLSNIRPGDEVIMPSYTFVSTANAFVLRGATPVFVDIRPDTLNIDENKIAAAITPQTKAIVPVHYAGVACNMDRITQIASEFNILIIEDAAQALMCTYKGRPLGSIGHMSAFSFHETKNIIAGEGGAFIANDPTFSARAEIIREKGTNRSQFSRGEVDKYTWVDMGSSYLPGEITAAFLSAQIDEAEDIISRRMSIWRKYHEAFLCLEEQGKLIRPSIPDDCTHNAHMYYVLMPSLDIRTKFIESMKNENIQCVFHYVPLHKSPMGNRLGCPADGELTVTNSVAERLVRLPLWIGIERFQDQIIDSIIKFTKYYA